MRKLIYAINVSLDGCVDHTKFSPDEGLMGFWTNFIRDAGLLAYGRITYQLMVPFWPGIANNPTAETKTDVDFARTFDSVPKLVFSKSLTNVEDKNSLVRTAPEDEIRKLKQEPGKNILLGGVAVPSYLADLGLIDEFVFVVAPVVVGEGRRLLEGIKHAHKLKLVDAKPFRSGSIALRYANPETESL